MEFSIPELAAAAKRAQPLLSQGQAETRALCALMVLSGSLTGCEINEISRRLSQSPPT
jgi:hypothetical protein